MSFRRGLLAAALFLAILNMAPRCTKFTYSGPAQYRSAVVVYGDQASRPEKHAAGELAHDLERVYGFVPSVKPASEFDLSPGTELGRDTALFIVGTAETNQHIKYLVEAGQIEVSAQNPGPEGFVIKSKPEAGAVLIAGSDPRGVLYGVYEFSNRFLGVDPLEFWTGKEPPKRDFLDVPSIDIRVDPPAFPLRGYFDNDSDHLANWRGKKLIIEFDTWKQIIDSAARLRYNYIDPFDTMGRTEFWVWPYYKKMAPDYHADLELINRVIDYAHEKGMLVQVSLYQGYEFYHLPYQKTCLSRHHDDWMETFRYYLDNTPIGKADMFMYSPRDPWWDRPYICPSEALLGIKPGPLHTRVINELKPMIAEHNPQARLIAIMWSDGKKFWEDGSYRPDPGIPFMWSDDGYGLFPDWPGENKGHEFGVYIHAGFWRNQVVQDPYPARIKTSTLDAKNRGLTYLYFVNGQSFKNYILNLEAAARAAWDPEGFDPEAFYLEWAARYFGQDAAPLAVESMKALHEAHKQAGGFASMTMETKINLKLIQYGVPYRHGARDLAAALEDAERSLALADKAAALVPEESRLVFEDQIHFPVLIYIENLRLFKMVSDISRDRFNPGIKARAEVRDLKARAPGQLDRLLALLNEGPAWEKWSGWYDVGNFRKYEPPPTRQELESALRFVY